MTYAATETSDYLHSPIELYSFNQYGIKLFNYTSGDAEVTYGGRTYEPIAIKRGRIEQNQNLSRVGLKFTMPVAIPLINQYITDPPSKVVDVFVHRFHEQDPDQEVVTLWIGRLVSVEFKGRKGTVTAEPLITSMRRPVLRRLYQVSCPHLLYTSACGVNEVPYRENATLTGVSGYTLTSGTFAAQPDGYFQGGVIRVTINSLPYTRAIMSHVGDTIELDLFINNLTVGTVVQALPGCKRNLTDCVDKFADEDNYGGFPYIPLKNAMGGGTPIW